MIGWHAAGATKAQNNVHSITFWTVNYEENSMKNFVQVKERNRRIQQHPYWGGSLRIIEQAAACFRRGRYDGKRMRGRMFTQVIQRLLLCALLLLAWAVALGFVMGSGM